MDFAFSDEQQAIRDTARRFASEHLAPSYRKREADGVIGTDITLGMGELGLIGTDLPEQYGGLGLDCVTTGIIIEEIAAAAVFRHLKIPGPLTSLSFYSHFTLILLSF